MSGGDPSAAQVGASTSQPQTDQSSAPTAAASQPDQSDSSGPGNLHAALSQDSQSAAQQPQQQQPSGIGSRLKAILGAMAGVPKAIVQSEANRAQQLGQMRQAAVQGALAGVTFKNAQAAEAVWRANLADKQYQNFDADHQLQVQDANLDLLEKAQKAGFVVRGVTSLDGGTAANTQSAHTNLQQINATDGGIPNMLHLHVGDSMISLQPRNPAAALPMINQMRAAQGLPEVDTDTLRSLPDGGAQMALDAINYGNPGQGLITEDTRAQLENRLALAKAQQPFDGQDQLVASLQKQFDTQDQILNERSTRAATLAAQQSQITSAQTTQNQLANIKATAGPEAAAQEQKSFAQAKGAAAGALAATGGTTASGTINPSTGADEGYLQSLPAQQQNLIRGIGEGRIELNPRMMASKDGKVLMTQLTQAYPNFDQSKAQSYFKTRQDFTSGKTSQAINAYNTAIAHLGTMFDHVSASNSLAINTPGATVHRQLSLDKQLVSSELAKAVGGGAMTDSEKDSILGSIGGLTVGSYQDRIQEAVSLLNGKLESYQQQWNNGAPPGAVSQVRILSPQSEATISRIKGNQPAQSTVKIQMSNGTTGTIPQANLAAAQQRDPKLQVLQ
jgi:hypothetical protein